MDDVCCSILVESSVIYKPSGQAPVIPHRYSTRTYSVKDMEITVNGIATTVVPLSVTKKYQKTGAFYLAVVFIYLFAGKYSTKLVV